MMLGFIEAHRQEHGVEPICRVLPIAPSTWRRHAARAADPAKLPARAQRDAGLKAGIRRVFEENFQVYGVRKVWRQLQREGIQVARCTADAGDGPARCHPRQAGENHHRRQGFALSAGPGEPAVPGR